MSQIHVRIQIVVSVGSKFDYIFFVFFLFFYERREDLNTTISGPSSAPLAKRHLKWRFAGVPMKAPTLNAAAW